MKVDMRRFSEGKDYQHGKIDVNKLRLLSTDDELIDILKREAGVNSIKAAYIIGKITEYLENNKTED